MATAGIDLADDADAELAAQLAGLLEGLFVHGRIKDDLGESIAVAKIDKDATTVVSAIVDPSGKRDGLALVRFAEFTAVVGLWVVVEKAGHRRETLAAQNMGYTARRSPKSERTRGIVCHNLRQMHITMVKKRLASGEPCRKCAQAEDLLRKRGLWGRIDEVIWADETDPGSAGMQLATKHDVSVAPFYLVRGDDDSVTVFVSALKLIKTHLGAKPASVPSFDMAEAKARLAKATPQEVVRHALESFGAECAIAFSGSDDVVLVELAAQTGLPFTVLVVDTGRLHPETYRFIEDVRSHYGIEIHTTAPEPAELEPFVRQKGLFSFLEDGHEECCQIRKVLPLKRALRGYKAWMTGQRKDQSLSTRGDLQLVEEDGTFEGLDGQLVKFNPIANWSRDLLWQYIRDHELVHNALHHRGYASIGCEPCTRPVLPGQHEREGRWWWEDERVKECGLHPAKSGA